MPACHRCDRCPFPAQACDYWLDKGSGGYDGPSSRALFELAHEVKSLLEPLRRAEAAKAARLHHLESILLQFNEVFEPGPSGDLASPIGLARALQAQQEQMAQMAEQLAVANRRAVVAESRCIATLAQHHRAHRDEMDRKTMQHDENLQQVRAACAAKIRAVRSVQV
jgi:hypothetical protein